MTTMNHQPFLLARWGEMLLPFGELAEKAKRIWITNAKAKIRSIILTAQSDIDRTDSVAELVFSGQSTSTPPCYHGY